MFLNTKFRSNKEEKMDVFSLKGENLRDALDNIAKINQLLGGNLLTLRGVQKLIRNFSKKETITILDVGCGMGGLSELIHKKGFNIESLTPNKNQIDFINSNYKYLTTHNCKFEDFRSDKRYGTVINSESIQYISLNDAFKQLEDIILPKNSFQKFQWPHYFRQSVHPNEME